MPGKQRSTQPQSWPTSSVSMFLAHKKSTTDSRQSMPLVMLAEPIGSFMTEDPRYLDATCRVRDAVQMVRQWRIDEIPVVDAEGQPLGMIDVQDLISLRVIDP